MSLRSTSEPPYEADVGQVLAHIMAPRLDDYQPTSVQRRVFAAVARALPGCAALDSPSHPCVAAWAQGRALAEAALFRGDWEHCERHLRRGFRAPATLCPAHE